TGGPAGETQVWRARQERPSVSLASLHLSKIPGGDGVAVRDTAGSPELAAPSHEPAWRRVRRFAGAAGRRRRSAPTAAAVQEAAGVAHLAVAGEFRQLLAGRAVDGNRPLQKPPQDGGRSVAHG